MSKSDDQELNSIMQSSGGGSSRASAKGRPRTAESESDGSLQKSDLIGFSQWTTGDKRRFLPASKTVKSLTPGVYDILTAPGIGIYFEKLLIVTRGILRFPQTNSDKVVNEIQKFWEREQLFRDYNLTYKRGIILWGPPGCHAAGTKMLMYDGTIKKVEDVVCGDLLMGPDSHSREVMLLRRGVDDMYRVTPNWGPSFVVNAHHVLHLERSGIGDKHLAAVVNVMVKDYLQWSVAKQSSYKLVHERKDVRHTGIKTVESVGKDHFYGFTLSGDHLYLTSDHVVHENSGKSCTIQLIIEDVVNRGGIVVKFTNPQIFLEGMRILREIQQTTPVVVLMEDIDSILDCHSESEVLNILDGVDQVEKAVFLATCFEPGTRFLTDDLRWVPCGDLRSGDALWAFAENKPNGRGSRRRFCRSIVLESFPAKKECVRVHVNTGESFICTTDHPWLTYVRYEDGALPGWTQKDGPRIGWTQAIDLMNRPRLIRPFMPWETDKSWEAGWLAGMLDGEGSISKRMGYGGCSNVTVAQNIGPTANHLVEAVLSRVDAHVYLRNGRHKNQQIIDTRGGLAAALQLIGQVRANRLISRVDLSGAMMHNKFPTHVVKIEPIGLCDIQSIQTTSKTYIAEGFACHNTNYPERLGPRIINRPSRFDKRFKIGHPNPESRKMYFEHIIGGPEQTAKLGIDLDTWVTDTEGFSIAHLKELFVAVAILGDSYAEAVETLGNMKDFVSSDHDADKQMGFNTKIANNRR